MFLLSAALLLGMQTTPEFAIVVVKETPKGCEYRVEGQRLTTDQLERRARIWAEEERIGEVQGAGNKPNACIGGTIDLMQRAGMQRVGYIGKPIGPTVILGLRAQGCVPVINGEAATIAQVRAEAPVWGRDKAELRFEPDSDVPYDCVDSVLKVLKESYPMKLGFIGYEQAPAQ